MKCKYCLADIPDKSLFCNLCGKNQNQTKSKRRRQNGEGSVYKVGNSWTVSITIGYDENGKRKYKRKGGFPTRKEALEFIPQLKRTPEPRKELTIENLWNTFESTQLPKMSSNTKKRYKTASHRLDPLFSNNIKDLTIDDWQDTVSSAVETYYPARDMRDLISWFYKLAMAQQEVTYNLAPFLLLPDKEEKEPVPFSNEEIQSFWNAWAQGYTISGYILLMIYSGMMPGELLRVTKNMIDLEAQTIRGAGLKTKKRKTTPIVIADVLLPVLEHLMHTSRELLLYPYSRDKFYEEYWACVKLCGVRKLPPYSCRHTTATALALANASPEMIKEVMRHSNLSTTQRYIHITPDASLNAVNTLMCESE